MHSQNLHLPYYFLASLLVAAALQLLAQPQNTDRFPQPTMLSSPYFEEIYYRATDKDGFVWLATNRGLFCFNGSFYKKINHSKDGLSAIDTGNINDLFMDEAAAQLWVASGAGASMLNLNSEKFTDYTFDQKDHPECNGGECMTITKDRQGTVWFGVEELGLFSLDTALHHFPIKTEETSCFSTIFKITQDAEADSILWLLASSLTGLVRFNSVTGEYTFPAWKPPNEAQERIILPQWLASWWAYLIYLFLGVALIYAAYSHLKRQWKIKAALEMEHLEAERLKELDALKTEVYTNITHEFRTPLAVILGMAKQLKSEIGKLKNIEIGKFIVKMGMIERNGESLLYLVNRMLDLSKLESGVLALNNQQGDVVKFLKYLSETFKSLAESKDIEIHFLSDFEELTMDFDAERLQQVIGNLLSNAFKFTPAGGNVYLRISKEEFGSQRKTSGTPSSIAIQVKDTGIGISQKHLPHIFDRFYQVGDTHAQHGGGAGIGLALTKELVKLMGGKITVISHDAESTAQGTTFTIVLPMTNLAPLQSTNFESFWKETSIPDDELAEILVQPPYESSKVAFEQPLLLLSDDNADVLAYLSSFLGKEFRLVMARDGKACLETATEIIPDLIVADVMMPNMNGFELCRILKNDERTSHIPIIMISAKTDMESKLEGLQSGADAYLTKPFDNQELLVRIKSMLEQRQNLQRHYRSLTSPLKEPKAAEVMPNSNAMDDYFVQRVHKIVEAHIDDSSFSVEKLCHETGISHAQLHRKLVALTGLSASMLIRAIRLEKASQLLNQTAHSIISIALDTGFTDPSYFGKVFKQEFGMTPTEWRETQSSVSDFGEMGN